MKKLTSFLIVALMIATTTFASENPAQKSQQMQLDFNKHFAAATSVSWLSSSNLTTANFLMNGQYLSVHYSPDAKMLGISRNVVSSDLPLSLQRDLGSYLSKYWITEAFEYATNGTDDYYVVLENADVKLILKNEAGRFYTYKKESKA
jgi:hypothetical protein